MVIAVVVSAAALGLVMESYDVWAYRKSSVTQTLHLLPRNPAVEYSLCREKRWGCLPGPARTDSPLTHDQYVNVLLANEFEPGPVEDWVSGSNTVVGENLIYDQGSGTITIRTTHRLDR